MMKVAEANSLSIIWKIKTLSFKKNTVKVFYEQKEMVHLLW